MEENQASWRLAAGRGFGAVARLAVFSTRR
jgi:hypothetical protein